MIKTINYHFTRVCNYACEFCFYTQKNGYRLPLEESKEGIRLLSEYGVQKINFAGGEPFVYASDLGEMIRYAKELGLATSVITNGSLVTEEWFDTYGQYLDVFGVSCDSFIEEVNVQYGRGKGNQVEIVHHVIELARKHQCLVKLNTVVYQGNVHEDMNEILNKLNVDRWKVFQMLYIPNENGEENVETKKKRNAKKLVVSDEEYKSFIERHAKQKNLVIETDDVISDSYILVDERMRFIYNDTNNRKQLTDSILDVGINEAFRHVRYNEQHFQERKGEYEWHVKNLQR